MATDSNEPIPWRHDDPLPRRVAHGPADLFQGSLDEGEGALNARRARTSQGRGNAVGLALQ
eukprot:3697391-Alexandrium_andersonii.AAC.1